MKYLLLLLLSTPGFAQVHLPEVAINGQGLDIVRKMIAAIPQNYDTSAIGMTAFYKEHIQLAADTLNYNESELEINRSQILSIKNLRHQTFKNKDFQFYNWISHINGAAASSLQEDVIRSAGSPLSFLHPASFRYYNYYIDTSRQQMLVIAVEPKHNNRKALLHARLFIHPESFALVRCEWTASVEGVRHINKHGRGGIRYTVMSKYLKGTMDFTRFRTVIAYKQHKGHYYLDSVSRHWEALINSRKRQLKDVVWQADFQLLVRDLHKVGADTPGRFTRADTLRGMLSPLRSCYDVTFYYLDVDVDMEQRKIGGTSLIRYRVMAPFQKMQIDMYANMYIKEILFRGQRLNYTREANAVFIDFPGVQPVGEIQEILVTYTGVPQTPDVKIPMNGGVLWERDSLGNPWVQVVCQGSGASLWWPCKDHLSDEPDSMQICITVPEGFTEISNGRLLRKVAVGGKKTRYEWAVSYPINNYNVTFSIGKYSYYTELYGSLVLKFYVMPYHLSQSRVFFSQVKGMLGVYERLFGPYPFERDGFTLVESLYPMEHQSGVCIGRIPDDPKPEMASIIWHEVAHEWWGNSISCKDVADMWIHEAFATYAEGYMYGGAFKEYINGLREQVANRTPVRGVYDVNHIFYNIGDMYSKGCLMLYSLQNVIDDSLCWQALLPAIQQHFRYQTLSAAELEQFICDFTGQDFHYLFDQYLHYTSIPKFQYILSEKGPNMEVKYRWVADVPDFHMPIKLGSQLIFPTREWHTLILPNQTAADFEVDGTLYYMDLEEVEEKILPGVG